MLFNQDLITELQDLRHLKWDRNRFSSGTAGSYLKSYEVRDGRKIYYKLSNFDSLNGVIGHECINELIVDRLLSVLGIDHLHYQLIHALIEIEGKEYETYLCASEDFKENGDSKLTFEDYYLIMKQDGESILDFAQRIGLISFISEMLLVDFLIINRDRHGANIEILKNDKDKYRPAPLFDHGLSFVFSCDTSEKLKSFDPLGDVPVQCFVGSHSTFENLNLINPENRPRVRTLKEEDKDFIFSDLEDILDKSYLDKISDIIYKRWEYYVHLSD